MTREEFREKLIDLINKASEDLSIVDIFGELATNLEISKVMLVRTFQQHNSEQGGNCGTCGDDDCENCEFRDYMGDDEEESEEEDDLDIIDVQDKKAQN